MEVKLAIIIICRHTALFLYDSVDRRQRTSHPPLLCPYSTMAYPFANNQYAQSSSYGHQGYNDPYATQPTQFGSSAAQFRHEEPSYSGQEQGGSYESEPSMVARDAQRDTSSVNAYGAYSGRQDGDYDVDKDEKLYNEGNSPYQRSAEMMGATPYVGRSIWTADDKRVMAKRNFPAKLFR